MKKTLFIFCLLSLLAKTSFTQVVSVKADVNATFPNVIEEKTRVLKYINQYSLVFIDSIDTTYLCRMKDFNYYNIINEPFFKVPVPLNCVISDMKNPYATLWFCGKNVTCGHGMYGWTSPSVTTPNYNQSFYMIFLPDMVNLREFVLPNLSAQNTPYYRMFAIGESQNGTSNHLLQLDVMGSGVDPTASYQYATADSNEVLDNIALVGGYVVVSTREENPGNRYLNIRVSDVINGISNPGIDGKLRINLQPDETPVGRIFVTYLENDIFEVSYIKYKDYHGYILCLHRITLSDLLSGINTIICQEINVEKGEFIQDITYNSVEGVLFILLDKDDNHSVFLHTLPHNTFNYPVIRLESAINERYFSIDTMNTFIHNPGRMYQAWGGNKCFEQRYATSGTILGSCNQYNEIKAFYVPPIEINKIFDPLTRRVGNRSLYNYTRNWVYSMIYSSCFIDE